MKNIKKYGIILGIMVLIIIFSTLFITLLNYFNIMNKNTVSIFKIITILVSMFIGGILIGKKANKKGYIEGLKIGSIFCIFLFIINIKNLSLKLIFYFLILICTSIFGSMIGIQKKD